MGKHSNVCNKLQTEHECFELNSPIIHQKPSICKMCLGSAVENHKFSYLNREIINNNSLKRKLMIVIFD